MIVVRWTRATHLVGDDGERIRQPGWTAILLMPGDGGLAVDDPPVGAGLDRNDVQSRWTGTPVLLATVPVDNLLERAAGSQSRNRPTRPPSASWIRPDSIAGAAGKRQ